ncbi:MAG: vWA domain-containing protein [Bdellovibrionota bacterium]
MKKLCADIQELLANSGPEALTFNEDAKRHLTECPDCFAFLEALELVNKALCDLPEHEPSEDLVAKVLADLPKHPVGVVVKQSSSSPYRFPVWQILRLPNKRALATVVSVFIAVLVSSLAVNRPEPAERPQPGVYSTKELPDWEKSVARRDAKGAPSNLSGYRRSNKYTGEQTITADEPAGDSLDSSAKQKVRPSYPAEQEEAPASANEPVDRVQAPVRSTDAFDDDVSSAPQAAAPRSPSQTSVPSFASRQDSDGDRKSMIAQRPPSKPSTTTSDEVQVLDGINAPTEGTPYPQELKLEGAKKDAEKAVDKPRFENSKNGLDLAPLAKEGAAGKGTLHGDKRSIGDIGGAERKTLEQGQARVTEQLKAKTFDQNDEVDPSDTASDSERPVPPASVPMPSTRNAQDSDASLVGGSAGAALNERRPLPDEQDDAAAGRQSKTPRRYLEEQADLGASENMEEKPALSKSKRERNAGESFRSVTGLRFQEAAGYWANTYIPGDPTIRQLNTTLLGKDRSQVEQLLGRPLKLHDAAKQPEQPFDVPENQSLGINIHSDRSSLQGEGRMLVQIGLKGTERTLGRRPAMNLGIVLDLRGSITAETADKVRELLYALNDAKDIGDSVRVSIAGRPGGLLIQKGDFKRGAVTVKLQEALAAPADAGSPNLIQAYETALSDVTASDDPSSPLGSSEMIVVSDQPLADANAPLRSLAQKAAVAGIPTSVVALGNHEDLAAIDNLVLAGQGNRRLMKSKDDAKDVISRELSSVSRAVAKAVRLRIRLAPGVKLVDVIGSYRLDNVRAAQEKAVEKSIDQRLAKNLGIESDRGDDEDGIQIIIPTFYSGDTHVILLDVVAPGAGPIAEVRARYKDLVHLKNAVVTDSLSLPSGESEQGLLEQNVMKNFLAFELSRTLIGASGLVEQGRIQEVAPLASRYVDALEDADKLFPNLRRDPSIVNDSSMLSDYIALIQKSDRANRSQREYLVQSLAYAGKRKVLPAPQQ